MREPRVLQDAKVSVRTSLALLWVQDRGADTESFGRRCLE